ncbi:hypothetical protein [Shewanella chilikensis]|uniref:hypothetical protein n=1 Tax=Shewanella chilikensis TaxID=558541 RepID=UPI003A96BBCC
MTTLEQFAFQIPLYTQNSLPDDLQLKAILYGVKAYKIDGHCPKCGKNTTFFGDPERWDIDDQWSGVYDTLREYTGYQILEMTCARNHDHKLKYYYFLGENHVEKVGQDPSLADIANDEAAAYRSILSKTDAAELHKAIGLAAHGIGIGSFVYLRRIFERLIYERFSSFSEEKEWDRQAFGKLRMNEKVEFLKGYIPDFLYDHRELYSILSKGIHELSDEECLKVFEPIKLSLKIILEEDKKKKDELALQKKASDAIKAIRG